MAEETTPSGAKTDVIAIAAPNYVNLRSYIDQHIQKPWLTDRLGRQPLLVGCSNRRGRLRYGTTNLVSKEIANNTRKIVLCDAIDCLRNLSVVPNELVLLDKNMHCIVVNTTLVSNHRGTTYSSFLKHEDWHVVRDNLAEETNEHYLDELAGLRRRFNQTCALVRELATRRFEMEITRRTYIINPEGPEDKIKGRFRSKEEAHHYETHVRPYNVLINQLSYAFWYHAQGGKLSYLDEVTYFDGVADQPSPRDQTTTGDDATVRSISYQSPSRDTPHLHQAEASHRRRSPSPRRRPSSRDRSAYEGRGMSRHQSNERESQWRHARGDRDSGRRHTPEYRDQPRRSKYSENMRASPYRPPPNRTVYFVPESSATPYA